MKLRNKIAAITAAAMLAFTGVGFASWVFNNQVQTQSTVSGTPAITCAVELSTDFKLYKEGGAVEVPALYLICDAPASGNSNVLPGNGVYWSTANDATAFANKIENVYIKGTLNYDGNDIDDLASVTVSFTSACSLVNGTYVTFGSPALPADVTVSGDALVDEAPVQSAVFALPVPAYTVAVNAFDNITDVDGITAGLANLSIRYNAQITAKTAA